MDSQQARRRQPGRSSRFGVSAVAAVLLLGPGPDAVAATGGVVDCDNVERDLKSLDVESDALALNIVEHIAGNDERVFDVPPGTPVLESEAVAPVLLLTPRVATILRQIFGSEVASKPGESAGSTADRGEESGPTTPVARDETPEQIPASIAPAIRDEFMNKYMPQFQRQMYRTDI